MYVVIAHAVGLPSRFVSTVTTYALGTWIAIYKYKIYSEFTKHPFKIFLILAIPVFLTYKLRVDDYILNVSSCFFALLVCWFMAHFSVNSRVLLFLGRHAFSIYILQRIPMTILTRYYQPTGWLSYVFVIILFAIIVMFAVLFDKALRKVDKIFLNN